MLYIDLYGGVSHTALCETLLNAIKNKKQRFTCILIEYLKKNTVLFKKAGSGKESSIDLFLLYKQCKGITLNREDAHELAGDMSAVLDTIILHSGENQMEAYDIIIYLALILLMEKMHMKEKVRILCPRIGTVSSGAVFQILKGIHIILDPIAPAITPMCSAFLVYYTDLFIHAIQGILVSFTQIPDPLQKNIRIQLFECDDWNTDTSIDEFEYDVIGVLETNIDDCTPEVISGAMSDILDSGALDYTITPVMMKKGRSGFQIQVLCRQKDIKRIAEELLKQTSSFGVRIQTLMRQKLKREIKTIKTKYGRIRVKLGYKGNNIIKTAPEFDDLKLISRTRGISLFHLYNKIMKEIMGEIKKGD
jgi:hypothetical protein